MSEQNLESSNQFLLNRLIARYLEKEQADEEVNQAELFDWHPEWAKGLRSFFVNHDQVRAPQEPSTNTDLDPPTIPPSQTGLDDSTIPPGELRQPMMTPPLQESGAEEATIPPLATTSIA